MIKKVILKEDKFPLGPMLELEFYLQGNSGGVRQGTLADAVAKTGVAVYLCLRLIWKIKTPLKLERIEKEKSNPDRDLSFQTNQDFYKHKIINATTRATIINKHYHAYTGTVILNQCYLIFSFISKLTVQTRPWHALV
ncbi:hypothetical protein ACJX0J_010058, partial [Zea mays]